MQRQQSAEQSQAGMWGGLTQLGAAGIKKWGARGGRIPGAAHYRGDTLANDTSLIHVSPGEVVVPRSIAMSNNPKAIVEFVKNAPEISTPDQKKEAMLSALRNMRRKGMR
jgi:hypothetical protein